MGMHKIQGTFSGHVDLLLVGLRRKKIMGRPD